MLSYLIILIPSLSYFHHMLIIFHHIPIIILYLYVSSLTRLLTFSALSFVIYKDVKVPVEANISTRIFNWSGKVLGNMCGLLKQSAFCPSWLTTFFLLLFNFFLHFLFLFLFIYLFLYFSDFIYSCRSIRNAQ